MEKFYRVRQIRSSWFQILCLEFRVFVVNASNSAGDTQSNVVILTVDRKVETDHYKRMMLLPSRPKPRFTAVRTADDIERDRERHRFKKEQETVRKRTWLNKILLFVGTIITVLAIGGFLLKSRLGKSSSDIKNPTNDVAKAKASQTSESSTNNLSRTSKLFSQETNSKTSTNKQNQSAIYSTA